MHGPVVITLAGVPVGKGRPRFVRATGRAYTPDKTRSYEDSLRLSAQVAMVGRAPLDGALSVVVEAAFPVPASWSEKKRSAALAGQVHPCVKPDADNLIKVLDAFNEIVWRDDKQVVEATIRKSYSDKPAFTVVVTEIAA